MDSIACFVVTTLDIHLNLYLFILMYRDFYFIPPQPPITPGLLTSELPYLRGLVYSIGAFSIGVTTSLQGHPY